MHLPLSHLARKLFVHQAGATVKSPGLVWEAPPGNSRDSGHWEMTSAGHAAARPTSAEPMVFMVEKVPGLKNPFSMGVTVGRVETNDVALDDASVSRFHAWLQLDERLQQWFLTDAESKNGTFVDGVQLPPKQRLALRDGASVKFGDVVVTFMLPETLTAFVEKRFRDS